MYLQHGRVFAKSSTNRILWDQEKWRDRPLAMNSSLHEESKEGVRFYIIWGMNAHYRDTMNTGRNIHILERLWNAHRQTTHILSHIQVVQPSQTTVNNNVKKMILHHKNNIIPGDKEVHHKLQRVGRVLIDKACSHSGVT